MSRPRCNFLIDKHEVILKIYGYEKSFQNNAACRLFSLETSRMFRNFTKQAQVTWSNDPRVLMHFLKRRSFLYLYVIEINAFQHNTVTKIITS